MLHANILHIFTLTKDKTKANQIRIRIYRLMTWETTNCLIQAEMKTDIHLKKNNQILTKVVV